MMFRDLYVVLNLLDYELGFLFYIVIVIDQVSVFLVLTLLFYLFCFVVCCCNFKLTLRFCVLCVVFVLKRHQTRSPQTEIFNKEKQ